MFQSRNSVAVILAVSVVAVPRMAFSQDHVVSRSDLQREAARASQSRERNLQTVSKLFSSEKARKTLASAKIDASRVLKAVPFLSDQELSRQATQADKLHNDVSAGALNNQEITYILIALATAVIILVIVVA